MPLDVVAQGQLGRVVQVGLDPQTSGCEEHTLHRQHTTTIQCPQPPMAPWPSVSQSVVCVCLCVCVQHKPPGRAANTPRGRPASTSTPQASFTRFSVLDSASLSLTSPKMSSTGFSTNPASRISGPVRSILNLPHQTNKQGQPSDGATGRHKHGCCPVVGSHSGPG